MTTIGWNYIEENDLKKMIESLSAYLSIVFYQTITKVSIDRFDQFDIELLSKIEQAKFFGAECELYCVRRPPIFHITFLSDSEDIFESAQEYLQTGSNEILELNKEKRKYENILWGVRDTTVQDSDRFWFEGRIPQKLHYPVENRGDRVTMKVIKYHEKNNWQSKFYRFKEIAYV